MYECQFELNNHFLVLAKLKTNLNISRPALYLMAELLRFCYSYFLESNHRLSV
jgi:hypothetical protein